MAERRKKIRGSTAALDAIAGLEGMFAFDRQQNEIRVFDGVTVGGFRVPNRQTVATDISSAISTLLTGSQPFVGPIRAAVGSPANPGYTFNGDLDTGLYRSALNTVALSAGGVKALELTSTGAGGSIFQTSFNDFAVGKVPLAVHTEVNTSGTLINSATNLNTLATPGKYYFNAASKPTNRPADFDAGQNGAVIVSVIDGAGGMMQELTSILPQVGLTPETINVWRRWVRVGSAGAWSKDYNAGRDTTNSRRDTTAGRLLMVGDYGLGTAGEVITDLNTINWTGICRFDAATPNAPFSFTGIVETVIQSSNQCRQFAYSHSDVRRIFTRCNVSGTWSAWAAIYNQSNILETVTQSGGVPTGGLFEPGSNANGEYVRFADGTQICTTFINNDSVAWTTAEGSLFRTATAATWTFPVAFGGANSPTVTGGVEIGSRSAGVNFVSRTLGSIGWFGWVATSAAAGINKRVMLSAIGRWY